MRRGTPPRPPSQASRWSSTWTERRTSASPFPVYVDLEAGLHPAVFATSDGQQHVVIRTGSFDLVEASPEARRRFVNLFEDMLAALHLLFQVHVGSRRCGGTECAAPRLAQFLRARMLEKPSFQRTVHLVLSDSAAQIERLSARRQKITG